MYHNCINECLTFSDQLWLFGGKVSGILFSCFVMVSIFTQTGMGNYMKNGMISSGGGGGCGFHVCKCGFQNEPLTSKNFSGIQSPHSQGSSSGQRPSETHRDRQRPLQRLTETVRDSQRPTCHKLTETVRDRQWPLQRPLVFWYNPSETVEKEDL